MPALACLFSSSRHPTLFLQRLCHLRPVPGPVLLYARANACIFCGRPCRSQGHSRSRHRRSRRYSQNPVPAVQNSVGPLRPACGEREQFQRRCCDCAQRDLYSSLARGDSIEWIGHSTPLVAEICSALRLRFCVLRRLGSCPRWRL
jgi:hypothetical protein